MLSEKKAKLRKVRRDVTLKMVGNKGEVNTLLDILELTEDLPEKLCENLATSFDVGNSGLVEALDRVEAALGNIKEPARQRIIIPNEFSVKNLADIVFPKSVEVSNLNSLKFPAPILDTSTFAKQIESSAKEVKRLDELLRKEPLPVILVDALGKPVKSLGGTAVFAGGGGGGFRFDTYTVGTSTGTTGRFPLGAVIMTATGHWMKKADFGGGGGGTGTTSTGPFIVLQGNRSTGATGAWLNEIWFGTGLVSTGNRLPVQIVSSTGGSTGATSTGPFVVNQGSGATGASGIWHTRVFGSTGGDILDDMLIELMLLESTVLQISTGVYIQKTGLYTATGLYDARSRTWTLKATGGDNVGIKGLQGSTGASLTTGTRIKTGLFTSTGGGFGVIGGLVAKFRALPTPTAGTNTPAIHSTKGVQFVEPNKTGGTDLFGYSSSSGDTSLATGVASNWVTVRGLFVSVDGNDSVKVYLKIGGVQKSATRTLCPANAPVNLIDDNLYQKSTASNVAIAINLSAAKAVNWHLNYVSETT
jgi:hypothetical protein